MGRSYKSAAQTHIRRARNRKAFEQVLDEYERRHNVSRIQAFDYTDDTSGSTNPITPSNLDFFCDVELAIEAVLKDDKAIRNFSDEYFLGIPTWNDTQKFHFEQKIGQLFVTRRIWPIKQYFSTVRDRYETAKR